MYRRTPILFRIADSFFRHQLLFWGALLVVTGVTMTALYARSKTFHAVAMTQVQSQGVANLLGAGDGNTWTTPAQKNVDHFEELVKQDQPGGFLDTALRDANLAHPINVNPEANDPRYALLEKNLSAEVESTNQFSISLTWDNQAETKSIVDALQKQYIAQAGVEKSIVSVSSVRFLDDQISDLVKRLQQSEKALTDFKRSTGGQLSDADSTYGAQLSSLQTQLVEKQITLGESTSKKGLLAQELAQMRPMSVAEQTVSAQSPLERQIAELLAKRETLLASGETPQHPDVNAIDVTIAALQKQQRSKADAPENRRNTLTKMQDNPQYQQLREQIADAAIAAVADQEEIQNLQQQIAKYQKLVAQIPDAQRLLADKTRDYRNLQEQYDNLQKQREQIQMQASLDQLSASSDLTPIGVTFVVPTTGRTKLIAMLFGSLILGCLVGGILIVLSEWADQSLRHESDAERLLGVPVLASLPEAADLKTVSRAPHALSGGAGRALTGSVPER